MSVAVNKWKYRLQYKNYFGGVTTVSRDQFKKINGFANMFYGWGGEDDDLNHRITKFNLTVHRTPAHMARFIMLKHDKVFFDMILVVERVPDYLSIRPEPDYFWATQTRLFQVG